MLRVDAAIAENSFNAENRTIEVVWSTGARGLRFDWDIGYFYEELSLLPGEVKLERLNAGASVLNTHQSRDLAAIIGAVVPGSAATDGKEGSAIVQFSEREDVAQYVKDIQANIIRFISIGYNVARYELVEKTDTTYPVYRATDWEPAEISFVPVPFDVGAQTRSDTSKVSKSVFVNRSASAETGENIMTPEQIEAKRIADAAIAAEAETRRQAELTAARVAGAAAERQRVADITTAANALPEAERAAFIAPLIADVAVTAQAARDAVLTKVIANQATLRNVNVVTEEDELDKRVRGATNWLMLRANVPLLPGQAAREAGEFRGMKLFDLARDFLERAGVKTRGMDQMTLVGKAFTHRGAANTTSDFAILLENTMHKILLAAFAIAPDTWTKFCLQGNVSDFRAHNRYRMGTFGTLDGLNEQGEFKRKQIPDGAKESITAQTKGNIVAISRQAIINDDMTAFSRLLMMLGRAAKLSVEVDVYAALASNGGMGPTLQDGVTLFHASHNNIGAPSALSVLGLDADRVVMASQMDVSGNEFLDLRPKSLLVPLALGGNAKAINGALYDPDTANKLQKPNIVQNLFGDIVDTPRITGTRRYLFADTNVAPVLEVAFLDGQSEPVLETEQGWEVDGTDLRVRYDYAVGAIGREGAVTNAGA